MLILLTYIQTFDKALIRRFDAVINFNRYSDEDLIGLLNIIFFIVNLRNIKGYKII